MLTDAARAASQHLDLDALVVHGPAAELAPQLRAAGLTVDEIVAWDAPVSRSERDRAAASAAPVPSADDRAAARRLLDAAHKAKGGARYARMRTLLLEGTGTMTSGGTTVPIEVTEHVRLGRATHVELTIGETRLVQVVRDGVGFLRQFDQTLPLAPGLGDQMMLALRRDPNHVLRLASEEGARLRLLASEELAGTRWDRLEITASDGDVVVVWIDPRTHLIGRITYTEDGQPATDELSDYRLVDGVRLPFRARRLVGDGAAIAVTYRKLRPDAVVPDSLFSP